MSWWQKLRDTILRLPILKQILDWSKRYAIPGLGGVPIYNIVMFIYNETHKDNISTRANSIAFSLFLAIFPAIIAIFTLLPLMPFTANYVELASNTLNEVLPKDAHDYLIGMITDITSVNREGLFSFGFVLAVFFASSGMLTLMAGFDKSYEQVYRTRSYIRKRIVAIGLMVILALLLVFSVVLVIIGNVLIDKLTNNYDLGLATDLLLGGFRWLLALLFIYLSISLIYRYGPSMHKRTAFINPGAILATLLSFMTSIGFSYFVNNFGRYNQIYGSIGALIVIMIWLQLNAFVLLIGYELNASIAVNRAQLMELNKE